MGKRKGICERNSREVITMKWFLSSRHIECNHFCVLAIIARSCKIHLEACFESDWTFGLCSPLERHVGLNI